MKKNLGVVPLVVDLDGTLLQSDLALESALSYVKQNPWHFVHLFFWLLAGMAHLKAQLAQKITLDVASLPYNPPVLELIKKERAQGRLIILATGSHKIYAEQIALHLNLFDHVMATEGTINFTCHEKRKALVETYGTEGFDYMGNSKDDLPVWAAARHAIVVTPERGVEKKARKQGNVLQVIHSEASRLFTWIKALRLHQWVKNFLLFVPFIASHQLDNLDLVFRNLCAFLFFGLCASSVYILNDLIDLEDDRRHPKKKYRSFASGALSLKNGLLAFPFLLLLAFGGALFLLPWMFTATLVGYWGLTTVYSFYLKRVAILDVITLASLYTLRLIAGTFACDLVLTFWILAFSMFIFLSLSLIKRYAELWENRLKGEIQKTRGRGYFPHDLELLSSLGASSGYLAVLVLALYIQDPSTAMLYHHPKIIWLACPLLLFWISRTWLLTHRGQMHEDPIVFALHDRISLLVGGLFAFIFWLAT